MNSPQKPEVPAAEEPEVCELRVPSQDGRRLAGVELDLYLISLGLALCWALDAAVRLLTLSSGRASPACGPIALGQAGARRAAQTRTSPRNSWPS